MLQGKIKPDRGVESNEWYYYFRQDYQGIFVTIWTVTRGRSGVLLQEHRTMNIILKGIESI